jgi:hypothetical protein
MKLLLPLLLSGCFKLSDQMTELNTTLIPFDNDFVTVDDAVIQSFETQLTCPDDTPATFHLVYRKDATEPAPIVILLHSGAFDYVMEHGEDGPLSGLHYHADSRLTGTFALRKVWETLGLQIDSLDGAERNLGTLPAAFANRGVVQFIPGNCWGDLWHNEEGSQFNDVDLDGFARNGRTFASWMSRLLLDADFADTQGVQWPVPLDASSMYLVGLGDGGRGVMELLNHPASPTFAGAAVDSVPDTLSAMVNQPADYEEEIEGLSRIFDDLEDIDAYSFAAGVNIPDRFYYLWSSANPQLPTGATQPAAATLSGEMGVVVHDAQIQDHVLSNSDTELAETLVSFLLGPDEGAE